MEVLLRILAWPLKLRHCDCFHQVYLVHHVYEVVCSWAGCASVSYTHLRPQLSIVCVSFFVPRFFRLFRFSYARLRFYHELFREYGGAAPSSRKEHKVTVGQAGWTRACGFHQAPMNLFRGYDDGTIPPTRHSNHVQCGEVRVCGATAWIFYAVRVLLSYQYYKPWSWSSSASCYHLRSSTELRLLCSALMHDMGTRQAVPQHWINAFPLSVTVIEPSTRAQSKGFSNRQVQPQPSAPQSTKIPSSVKPLIVHVDMHVLLLGRNDFIFIPTLESRKFLNRFLHDAESLVDLLLCDHQRGCQSDDVGVGWFGLDSVSKLCILLHMGQFSGLNPPAALFS